MGDRVQLEISRRRLLVTVLVACLAIEVALVWLDYYVSYQERSDVRAIRRLFNITREDGLAGWFGPVQTLLLALTMWLVWAVERRRRPGRWPALGWAVVASFFTYMAVDDGSKLHERIGTAFAERASGDSARALLDAFPSYAWQLVFLPGLALLGAFTLLFLWRELPDRTARLLVTAGIGCFVAAVALDFVEGLDAEQPWHPYPWLVDRLDLYRLSRRHFGRSPFDVIAHFSKSIEEAIEMFGTTLLWVAVLRHLVSRTDELRLRFTDDPHIAEAMASPRA